ncbi:MAG: 8-oxo-dGTP diphosphatase [Myxococcota bacterium]
MASADEARPHIRVVAAEIEDDGSFLITQRRPEASMPLLWEFPGGRVADGESDADALSRTINARIGCGATVGEKTMEMSHDYEAYTLSLVSYRVTLIGTPTTRYVNDLRWVKPEDFGDYEFPGADQKTVDTLLSDD